MLFSGLLQVPNPPLLPAVSSGVKANMLLVLDVKVESTTTARELADVLFQVARYFDDRGRYSKLADWSLSTTVPTYTSWASGFVDGPDGKLCASWAVDANDSLRSPSLLIVDKFRKHERRKLRETARQDKQKGREQREIQAA